MVAIFHPTYMKFHFDPTGDPIRPWVVEGRHTFCDGSATFAVEDGFCTDLASVPLCLAWLCPPNGAHQRAATFHDAAYKHQFCNRFTADAGFRTIMAADLVPYWRRTLMFYAVRLFGGAAWRKRTRSEQ
jgi:hypothetical protein